MVSTVRATLCLSPAPMYWAIMTVAPMAKPINREASKKMMGNPVPTAVSAEAPTNWPTTMESTILYSCCRTFPSSSGREKATISRVGEP